MDELLVAGVGGRIAMIDKYQPWQVANGTAEKSRIRIMVPIAWVVEWFRKLIGGKK